MSDAYWEFWNLRYFQNAWFIQFKTLNSEQAIIILLNKSHELKSAAGIHEKSEP